MKAREPPDPAGLRQEEVLERERRPPDEHPPGAGVPDQRREHGARRGPVLCSRPVNVEGSMISRHDVEATF